MKVAMPRIDWTNLEQVWIFAKRLGKGQTVVWNGTNFQIMHTVNEGHGLKGRIVVART